MSNIEEVYAWLKDINDRHPPFDITTWIPLSVRYRHLPIKVFWRMDIEDMIKLPTADEVENG